MVSIALAASYPSLAQKSDAVSASAEPVSIISQLDLNSFPNSTGPGRRLSAHTPANYGFTKIESFPDGWVQLSQPDDSWHLGALKLGGDKKHAILCFTDSAGNGGTYRSTQVLEVKLDKHAPWAGVPLPDRSDCKNLPPKRSVAEVAVEPAPAAILRHLNDFRDTLSTNVH